MMDVLVALIGEKESDMLITPFQKSGSTDHCQLLTLHLGFSKWRLVADIHTEGISHL
jgi:hypothetical protein